MGYVPDFDPRVTLLTLVNGCADERQADVSRRASAPLKIVSWNLEHLAERNGQGCCPRTDVDYAELRRHADALAADVIALQEVESKVAAEQVFDPAGYDVVMSARPQSRRGGTCYGKPGQSIGHQAVGFAIRKGVSWTRNDDLSALTLGSPTCAGVTM
jgi:endonuclease/exonuclease/phosphatase family metal-dependent hydrolase